MDDQTDIEVLARVCHDANRAYCLAIGEDPEKVYPAWEEAPPEICESARIGVRAALQGASPAELHASWCDTKIADGWIYGPVKDLATLQHPCLVPYAELPPAQRTKDRLFAAIVKALRQ
jgi:hypothetical protein